ncbi:hypothetical protein J5N97_000797 [Dioscorea zingiberensis]|uniref:NADH dehydrogenase [ubiquinone] iron-sulfur protein 4, mitochondrial n=1 Tax=Dioscorea zingiberensis TaxID=325984 RepID=A0A9D5BV54_9LILI|nr:hypothetical protein J5N97_000797 [Dioscorea zingiberensis]
MTAPVTLHGLGLGFQGKEMRRKLGRGLPRNGIDGLENKRKRKRRLEWRRPLLKSIWIFGILYAIFGSSGNDSSKDLNRAALTARSSRSISWKAVLREHGEISGDKAREVDLSAWSAISRGADCGEILVRNNEAEERRFLGRESLRSLESDRLRDECVNLFTCFRTAQNQQGSGKVGRWKINFLSTQKWENPLMGWTSTGDPYANVGDAALSFDSEEAAKAFAEKHGWDYVVRKRHTPILKVKAYADNFKWKGPPKSEEN